MNIQQMEKYQSDIKTLINLLLRIKYEANDNLIAERTNSNLAALRQAYSDITYIIKEAKQENFS